MIPIASADRGRWKPPFAPGVSLVNTDYVPGVVCVDGRPVYGMWVPGAYQMPAPPAFACTIGQGLAMREGLRERQMGQPAGSATARITPAAPRAAPAVRTPAVPAAVPAAVIRYPAAGFVRRVFSELLDVVLLSVMLLWYLGEIDRILEQPLDFDPDASDMEVLGVLIERQILAFSPKDLLYYYGSMALYQVVWPWLFGETIGKKLFGLRVVNVHTGAKPGMLSALVRAVVKTSAWAFAAIVFLSASLPTGRCPHDRASGTEVVCIRNGARRP